MPTHGNTDERGYGREHQKLRAKLAPIVAAGGATCWRCGEPIHPRAKWDLGHVPGSGKRAYRGPEHRACNRDTIAERQAPDPDPRPTTRW